MKNFITNLSIVSVLALSQASMAQQTNTDPIQSEAITTLKESSDFLAAQTKISVGWFVTYDEMSGELEQETHAWGGDSLLIRGQGYYAVSERNDSVKEYFYDGSTFTASDISNNYYSSLPMTGSFDEMVLQLQAEHGLTLPVWEILSANITQDLVEDLTQAKYIDTVRILGQWAHHLSFSETDQDWEIWISTDKEKPVPLMMTGRYKDGNATRYQALFHHWNFKPRTSRKNFQFKPKSGSEKLVFSTLRNSSTAGEDFEPSNQAPQPKENGGE